MVFPKTEQSLRSRTGSLYRAFGGTGAPQIRSRRLLSLVRIRHPSIGLTSIPLECGAMTRSCVLLLGFCAAAFAADDGWIRMFDGKTLSGWKVNENESSWSVKDGAIVGDGDRSHIFYMLHECQNCEFKAMVKLNHGGNSGMYFRAKFEKGWPAGYEAQVNNTHQDWKRTGSLYNIVDVREQLVPDDTWWTQHIIADGNHIVIKVNGKTVVDYKDEKNSFTKGYLALQQHNPGSVVQYKDLMMRPLPAR